jgi:hypothetical protein
MMGARRSSSFANQMVIKDHNDTLQAKLQAMLQAKRKAKLQVKGKERREWVPARKASQMEKKQAQIPVLVLYAVAVLFLSALSLGLSLLFGLAGAGRFVVSKVLELPMFVRAMHAFVLYPYAPKLLSKAQKKPMDRASRVRHVLVRRAVFVALFYPSASNLWPFAVYTAKKLRVKAPAVKSRVARVSLFYFIFYSNC